MIAGRANPYLVEPERIQELTKYQLLRPGASRHIPDWSLRSPECVSKREQISIRRKH